jgi:hypothetical protein
VNHTAISLAADILRSGPWSSPAALADGCRPLVGLTDAASGWAGRYAEATIREMVPLALRVGRELTGTDRIEQLALRCESDGTWIASRLAGLDLPADCVWGMRAAQAGERAASIAARGLVGTPAYWPEGATADGVSASWSARAAVFAACAVQAGGDARAVDGVLRRAVGMLVEAVNAGRTALV